MNSLRVTHASHGGPHDEGGAALLIAVVLLLLMSALGITALQHAQDEASASGRSRRKDATLYAGEAGLAQVQATLLAGYSAPGGVSAFTINEPALVNDSHGNPIAVRSGRPDVVLPEAIGSSAGGTGETPDGFQIGAGAGQAFSAVRADIVATDSGNGTVHLQAQYRLYEGGGGLHY